MLEVLYYIMLGPVRSRSSIKTELKKNYSERKIERIRIRIRIIVDLRFLELLLLLLLEEKKREREKCSQVWIEFGSFIQSKIKKG